MTGRKKDSHEPATILATKMKRALLISYYFPPAGGVSSQRILKFARYLPQFGYQTAILTVDPAYASYPVLDPTLAAQVPEDTSVTRTRAWDPFTVYASLQGKRKADVVGIGFVKEDQERFFQRCARWIRGNVFLPDARVGWVPFARRAAGQLMRAFAPDVILTTGPPHSTHLVGRHVSARCRVPWVADFRDPWTDYFYNANLMQSRGAQAVQARMERAVLTRADLVLTVSEAIGSGLKSKATIRRYATLPNGYDAADMPARIPVAPRTGPFVVAHVGTLTREQHAPGLLHALSAIRPAPILRFVGHVHQHIIESCEESGLADQVQVIPFVPHQEAIAEMRRASLLWVSVGTGLHTQGIVTGKVFEYLSTGVPVLGTGPTDGDLATLLVNTNGGRLYHPDDASAIKHYVRMLMAGELRPRARADALKAYDRRVLAKRLASLFDSLL